MARKGTDNMIQENDEIDYITLHSPRPVYLHGYVAPFLLIYSIWAYFWIFVIGVSEYYEAGLIAFAGIGIFQILICLFCHWSVHVKTFMTCSTTKDVLRARLIKVVPTPNNGSPELVVLQKGIHPGSGKCHLWFYFQKTKYYYDSEEKKQFKSQDFPMDWSFEKYMGWKGYESDESIKEAEWTYGANNMKMDIPQFIELFKERATAPFFVFQVFCVGLWCLDEYWYYSVFTLFMLVAFECTLVQQQLRNMSEIRKMGNKPYQISCFRNRKWRPVNSDELIPGDIVSIGRSDNDRLVPCDMLLLRGSCIVDESMLTGESVPVMKEPIEMHESSTYFDIKAHGKLHVLFGGTKVVQHSPPAKTGAGMKASDNGCIAFVLRSSFNTSQGKLLRTILYGVKRVTANNLETFLFILFLLIFAVIAASYVWIKGTENPKRNRYKLFLECTLILTSVVPPELPIELSLAVNSSLLALSKLFVFCTEPFRIPFAGKIDICCFDKTGTLTSDSLVVEGIAGLSDSEGAEIKSVSNSPTQCQHVLATCHSLVQLGNELVGDPLEKATLSAVDWIMTKGDAVMPNRHRGHGLKIFQRFHFASSLKRMSVIAGYTPAGSETEYIVTVKGAPEMLKDMYCKVPSNYDDIYLELARRGARVLALGYRKIGTLSNQQLREMTREAAEKDLEFVGFVIISCPLKSDSKSVVKEILNSSHLVTMITGDNPLTACHVAKELRMIKRKHTLILTGPNKLNDEWHWQSVDDSLILEVKASYQTLKAEYDLCLTGDAFQYLRKNENKFLNKILPYVRVLARVAPKEKEAVITILKDLGYTTLMCGDGTNDVGALKHAHVGVALLANAPERPPGVKEEKLSINHGVDQEERHRESRNRSNNKQNKSKSREAISQTHAEKKLGHLLKQIEEEDKAQVVRLGDASIASPFTSKLSTTMCVCHIIKQGRCTLVTTLQMFKILALNALILAYSQSVLYLDGVKFSDTQATLQGLLLAGCFLFISRSKPLKILAKERPLPNIFNVYTILTVLGQFAVHFTSLVYLKTEAQILMPKNTTDGGYIDLEADFKPNILNSTVYLISIAMQVTTFAVNYKGHPFMESLSENKFLLYSLLISGLSVVGLASGLIPEVAEKFELVEFEPLFRENILKVLALDFVASFAVDRVLDFLFGRSKKKS